MMLVYSLHTSLLMFAKYVLLSSNEGSNVFLDCHYVVISLASHILHFNWEIVTL